MFLYVIENKVNNLKIGEKYFTSRVVLDFNKDNGVFENRLKFFNNCFEDTGLFETKFKSFVLFDGVFFDFAEEPEKKRLFITGCYCKKLNVTVLISEFDPDSFGRQKIIFFKKINESIYQDVTIDFRSKQTPDEEELKKNPFLELIHCEKYPSTIPRIMEAQKTHEEKGFISVEQMAFIQWRLTLNKIEHQTNFFKVKVIHHPEHFPFKDINSWQFGKIYDYLDEKDQVIYGYLRREYNKDLLNFLSSKIQ